MSMKKRILSLVLAISIFLTLHTAFPIIANATTSGICGENLTWEIDQEGTLTISGTGDMYGWNSNSYPYSYSPWNRSSLDITNVVIINGVTNIGMYAFYGCKNLESITIPNSVISIDEGAFDSCKKLSSITLPNSVTNIGKQAFSSCESLKSVYITDLKAWCNCTFYDSTSNPLGCAENLYLNNKLVTELVVPNGVEKINKHAFKDYKNLTSVVIPVSVTSIEDYAFDGCDNLINVVIPNGVTNIGGRAFSYCNKLPTITIPDSVTSIGGMAFIGCSSLKNVTIPDNVTYIGRDAFYGCDSLTNINVYENNKNYSSKDGVLFNKDKTLLITYPMGKSNAEYTIPNSVTTIGISAFNGCNALNSITISSDITSVSIDVFDNCDNLANINVDENNKNYSSKDGVLFNKDKSVLIRYPIGKTATEYIITNSVTSIGRMAFNFCDNLIDMTIPGNVTSIGSMAFNGCGGLTNVYITDLKVWCNYTFDDRTSNPLYYAENLYLNNKLVTELAIPDGIENINKYAFAGWDSLISVTIPDSITNIGTSAFNECKNLTNVYITDLEAWCNCTFGDNPLHYAENLYLNNKLVTELVIPYGVEKISKSAFRHCDSLTSVIIPDSVTSIGDYAFDGCGPLPNGLVSGTGEVFSGEGLKEITISGSVTDIGMYAFKYCNNLKNVYYKGTAVDWASITINRGNTPLTNATINYVACTKTSISDSGKIFTITPKNIENEKTIILALYENGKFVEMQHAIYEGNDIPFTTTKTYTEVKVMVWNDLTKFKPVCDVEIVN